MSPGEIRIRDPGHIPTKWNCKSSGIWQKVLGNHRIRPDDDFFYLGGDSLQAVRIVVATEELFKIHLQPGILLEKRSVRELADHIRNISQHTSPMICLKKVTGHRCSSHPCADSGAFRSKKLLMPLVITPG